MRSDRVSDREKMTSVLRPQGNRITSAKGKQLHKCMKHCISTLIMGLISLGFGHSSLNQLYQNLLKASGGKLITLENNSPGLS